MRNVLGAERLLNAGSAYPICYNWDFLRQEKTAVCGESLQHNGLKRELRKISRLSRYTAC